MFEWVLRAVECFKVLSTLLDRGLVLMDSQDLKTGLGFWRDLKAVSQGGYSSCFSNLWVRDCVLADSQSRLEGTML